MRIPIAAATLFMLAGCWWTGPVFYKPDPAAAAPISAGIWEGTGVDGEVSSHRIARYPNGAFGLGTGETDDKSRLTFRPLRLAGRDLWITELTAVAPDKDEAIYGLAERRGETIDLLALLGCEGNEDLIRTAGGKAEGGDRPLTDAKINEKGEVDPKTVGTSCTFTDAASLERALTAYATLHPHLDGVRLTRTGD